MYSSTRYILFIHVTVKILRYLNTLAFLLVVIIILIILLLQYGDRLKLLCIELYIRGLSLNLNEIEGLKALGDDKLVQANKDLADGFLQLAELFSGNESVCRECILSSFALNPTKETLQRIQTLLKVEDSAKPTESCAASGRLEKCSNHDKYNCTCSSSNFLAIQLDQDILKSAPHLPDDLATVLSRSRPNSLTWSLGKRLDSECQKYLKNYKGPELNKKQELQYLNIDYSQFKDWPKEEPVEQKPKIRKIANRNSNGKASEVTVKPRGRPRKAGNAPVIKKICPVEVISDSSISPEESDDPDYVPEVDFQAIKPATHSVGTSVSLPRPRRESSTQTEPPFVPAKRVEAVHSAGASDASVRQVTVSPPVVHPPAVEKQPVVPIQKPVAKQPALPALPEMTRSPAVAHLTSVGQQTAFARTNVPPASIETRVVLPKMETPTKPTQRIPGTNKFPLGSYSDS